MEHALCKDEHGQAFCICGWQPWAAADWTAKGEVLRHVTDARLGIDSGHVDGRYT